MQEQKSKCKYCNDKGYYSCFIGTTIAPDFIGDKRVDSGLGIRLIACPKCNKENKKRLKDVIKNKFDL